MSSPPTPNQTAPAAQDAEEQAANTRLYRATLHELIEMGTSLARAVHKEAMAQADANARQPNPAAAEAPPAATSTTDFDRIVRCVRRTVLLAQRIAEPPRAAQPRATQPGTVDRTAARTRILRAVEDTIDRHAFTARTPLDTDALHAELHERLDSPDLDDDIASRPVADIITEIVRDLAIDSKPFGVCPSRRRRPADIAALRARAAAPIGAAPPTPHPGPVSPRPRAAAPVPRRNDAPPTPAQAPAPVMVPIPEDPPPDLAAMLALCTQLARDG